MADIDAVRDFAETLRTGVVLTGAALDGDGPKVLYVNPAMEELTGHSRKTLQGSTPRILQGKATSRFTLRALRAALEAGRPFHTCLTNYRANGEAYLCEIDIRPQRDAKGAITGFLAFEREVVRRRVRARPGQNARYKPIDAAVEAEALGPLARFGCFATPLD